MVTKPPIHITEAINTFVQLNKTVQEHGGIHITVDNALKYAELISEGKIMVLGVDGQIHTQIMPNAQLLVLTSYANLVQQIDCFSKGIRKPSLVSYAKSLLSWRDSIYTAAKFYTDTQFQALVVIARENIGDTGCNPRLVHQLTCTIWANVKKRGQTKFIHGVAKEFAEAAKDIGRNNL